MAPDESSWIVAPDQADIDIKIGTQTAAGLPPDLRAKLEDLASTLASSPSMAADPRSKCEDIAITECAILIMCGGIIIT